MERIDIVIVNWNSGQHLKNCLASLEKHQGEYIARVVIVDNGSTDDSAEEIENYDIPLVIIRNKWNLGFAKACNQGARHSDAEYLLFLNPDVLFTQNPLPRVMDFMKQNPRAGVCGIQLYAEGGVIQKTCSYFPTPLRILSQEFGINRINGLRNTGVHMFDWDHQSSCPVDHVIGAFYFVRRKLFRELDGFDERFFVYYEDLDFSWRVYQAGYHVMYLSDVSAFHHGGGTSEGIKARRFAYSLHSKLKYSLKHFHLVENIFLISSFLFLVPLIRIVYGVITLDLKRITNTISGTWCLWRMMVRGIGAEIR